MLVFPERDMRATWEHEMADQEDVRGDTSAQAQSAQSRPTEPVKVVALAAADYLLGSPEFSTPALSQQHN